MRGENSLLLFVPIRVYPSVLSRFSQKSVRILINPPLALSPYLEIFTNILYNKCGQS